MSVRSFAILCSGPNDPCLRTMANSPRSNHKPSLRGHLSINGAVSLEPARILCIFLRHRGHHIARLAETKHVFRKLPTELKKKASLELVQLYKGMIGIDSRLERLDTAVAENEHRIRQLTQQAEAYSAQQEFQKLTECLKSAEKLQQHNDKLFKIIERTEAKLAGVAQKVAQEVDEVDNA